MESNLIYWMIDIGYTFSLSTIFIFQFARNSEFVRSFYRRQSKRPTFVCMEANMRKTDREHSANFLVSSPNVLSNKNFNLRSVLFDVLLARIEEWTGME